MPYKGSYSIGEMWDELIQSSYWKNYATANPGESDKLSEHVRRKVAGEGDFVPTDEMKTHFGRAHLMCYMSMQAQPSGLFVVSTNEGIHTTPG